MDTLPLITQMFGLIAFGALIWLTIRAFKKNAGWGFAVLLLSPLSATMFGVKHWDEEREPFLLFITTFTATFTLCAYLFAVSGGLQILGLTASLERGMQAQAFAENSADGFMRASYSVEQEPMFAEIPVTEAVTSALDMEAPVEEIAAIEDTPVAEEEKKPVRYRLTYIPIKLSEIRNYIGTTAKIKRKNVTEKEYQITGASHRHIELAQRSKGGKFSFHFKNSDIDSIRVLINEPY